MINIIPDQTSFIPDIEPRVFNGRVYLYGSHDIFDGKNLCEGDYECWSADINDLSHWKNEGVIYKRIQDPYIQDILSRNKGSMFNQYLYAPDVIKIHNLYYLYYGVAMSGSGIGVAVSDKPEGPFEYLGRVHYPSEEIPADWKDPFAGVLGGYRILGDGMPMIQLNPFRNFFGINMKNYVYDPALLYDNGHLYLYFGCSYCYVTEIDTRDMLTLKPVTGTGKYIIGSLLPSADEKKIIAGQMGWHMGNGSSIRKIGHKYYLSYYAVNKNKANAICYSMADSPIGPFTYSGVLLSLGNADGKMLPDAYTGNTHGGMFEADQKWYQIYHRHTGNKSPARQSCIVQLTLNKDGTFNQAEYKSVVGCHDAFGINEKIPAYSACVLLDSKKRCQKRHSPYFDITDADGCRQMVVTGFSRGSVVGYKYIDFGKTDISDCILHFKNKEHFKCNIYIDSITRENLIAEITEQPDIHMHKFHLVRTISGIHSVYFEFGEISKKAQLAAFKFYSKAVPDHSKYAKKTDCR